MKLSHRAALTALLVLAGCATPPAPKPDAAVSELPVPMQVVVPAGPPSIPSGPLQPITASEAASLGVAQLQPPADLWERIRRGFAMPDLESDLVRQQEQWYLQRPDYIQRMTERSRKYLFHIVEEL